MNRKWQVITSLAVWCAIGTASATASTVYEYDQLHRLTRVTYDGGLWIQYAYDPVGNIVLEASNTTTAQGYLFTPAYPPGSGSVTRNPEQQWYTAGTPITLTPVAGQEYTFDHWSGDVPVGREHENPLVNIPMASHGFMEIQAHFTALPRPVLCRTPATLTNTCLVGQNAPDQFFEVWNCGPSGTVLTYTISDDGGWLWYAAGGTSSGEHDQITVHYLTAGLSCGTYNATITLNSPRADNVPQTIAVTLTVTSTSLAAPTLLTPINGATGQATDGTLDWTDVAGATGYRVQLGTACGSGTEYVSSISQLAYAGLQPSETYSWRVKTRNACGAYGDYSNCFSFTTTGPPCLLWDMNADGFISIVGDALLFVNCVYFLDCQCPGGCTCPGDCNASGFLSISGDVPCFVDCVYFGDCQPPRGGPRSDEPRDTFTIGGAVYTDLSDPLASGLEGVRIRLMPIAIEVPDELTPTEYQGLVVITIAPDPRPAIPAPSPIPLPGTRSGAWGVWQIDGVSPGTYIVQASLSGYVFEHVEAGIGTGSAQANITVGPENEAANQSIQFLAQPRLRQEATGGRPEAKPAISVESAEAARQLRPDAF